MRRKKIIHIIQALDSGGCENMLLRTLPLLSNFEHTLITLRCEGKLAKKFTNKNIRVVNIGQKSFLDFSACLRLLKEIKKIQPDFITTYLFHADVTGRLFLQLFTKIKIIPFLRTTYNHKKYWIARLFEKLTKHFVKNYLTNSESVKNFYVEKIGVKKEKITVIPNGIDVAFYDKIERDENLRESLGIKKEEIAIICVANLHINKGHKYLLEAFEEVYKKNKNIKLLLAGDGKEKNNLLEQAKNYKSKNNISFLGRRNDVPQLLKISNIFVLPTLFEGMSNAILEAMAAGLLVITSSIPENEILVEDNKTGMLFPPKDKKRLLQKIETALSNPAMKNRLAENARVSVQEKFGIHKIKILFEKYLEKFCK